VEFEAMTAEKPDLLPGTLEMLVLKALAGGQLHGYAIARRIQQSSGDVLQVEEGSLYPALHRLERKRLLESEWGASESNRRAKYYRLTPAGRRELRRTSAAWQRISEAVAQVMNARPEGA
jgi:PadR family transcriptional regulator PadR